MEIRICADMGGTLVHLSGTYDPPPVRGEGMYGHFKIEHGVVVASDPLQIASAEGIEGPSLDAIVARAMARVGRATW